MHIDINIDCKCRGKTLAYQFGCLWFSAAKYVYKKRHNSTRDIPGAYIQTDMVRDFHVKLERRLAKMPTKTEAHHS